MEVLYGLHPVEEAIRSGSRQLDHVSVARERRDDRLERLIELCRTAGVRVSLESRDQLTRLARTDAHQGVLAVVRERKFLGIEDLLAPKPEGQYRFFLALDGVEDPHNLGALLRPGAWTRGRWSARSGEEDLRSPAEDSYGGTSVVAQCVGCGRDRDVRS